MRGTVHHIDNQVESLTGDLYLTSTHVTVHSKTTTHYPDGVHTTERRTLVPWPAISTIIEDVTAAGFTDTDELLTLRAQIAEVREVAERLRTYSGAALSSITVSKQIYRQLAEALAVTVVR